MSNELWTDESFDQPTNKEYPNLNVNPNIMAVARARVAEAREAEAEAASDYGGSYQSRATRSDKGRVRIMKCNRCGETLNNGKIVVTTTGLDGKLSRDRQRYCSQKCFNKAYRKGLSRLLPI